MIKTLGHIREVGRYPVKSMAGTRAESAFLGLHGLNGDRRFGLRRLRDESSFPWLTASHCPQLLLYRPCRFEDRNEEPLPTHVRTPHGNEFGLLSEELQNEISGVCGEGVEVMNLRHGIFDDASLSIISSATLSAICGKAGVLPDARRFRPNIVVEADSQEPFLEDRWIGGTLLFGNGSDSAAVAVTAHDVRCMIINLDPDSAIQNPDVLKTVVRTNDNKAGVYGTVVRTGTVRVGDPVQLNFRSE